MSKLTHEQEAKLIEQYREKAKFIVKGNSEEISINKFGSVQICEEGAFVECVIWVSKDEL